MKNRQLNNSLIISTMTFLVITAFSAQPSAFTMASRNKQKTIATDKKAVTSKKLEDVNQNPQIIIDAAVDIFTKIQTADYKHFLDSKKSDVWKDFPITNLYNSHKNYPRLVKWMCKTFDKNPIFAIQLGKINISKTAWPTVPYKVELLDGKQLNGILTFEYFSQPQPGKYKALHGLDWHLDSEKAPQQQNEIFQLSSTLFNPTIIERMVNTKDQKTNFCIDFDTARLLTAPQKIQDDPDEFEDWIMENGVDATAEQGGINRTRFFTCYDTIAVPVENKRWNEPWYSHYEDTITDWANAGSRLYMSTNGPLPKTFIFKTLHGCKGILQIIALPNSPRAIQIRYKTIPSRFINKLKKMKKFQPQPKIDPDMMRLQRRLDSLNERLKAKLSRLDENHPEIQKVKKKIADIEQRLKKYNRKEKTQGSAN